MRRPGVHGELIANFMERPSIRSTITFAFRSWIARGANYLEMSRAEFMAAAGLFALMIAFKLVNIVRYRFDSDESQHMHVIWAWARGFVQYRDIFDNHMPLFQIMFAPIFGLIGDRPTILYWMRSEEHTSELQSRFDLVCRLLLEKKKFDRQAARPLHLQRCTNH